MAELIKIVEIFCWLTDLLVRITSRLLKSYGYLSWITLKLKLWYKNLSNCMTLYYPYPCQSLRNTSRLLYVMMPWNSTLFLSYYPYISTYTSFLLNFNVRRKYRQTQARGAGCRGERRRLTSGRHRRRPGGWCSAPGEEVGRGCIDICYYR